MTLTNLRYIFVKRVKLSQTYFNVPYCKANFSYAYYTFISVRNKIRIIRTVALWLPRWAKIQLFRLLHSTPIRKGSSADTPF